jgi:predicted nucleotidyltransferase
MITATVPGISEQDLAAFCRRWKVAELYLFGSGARGELREDSDLDFMVEFLPREHWNAWDFVDMREELMRLVGRPVDLVEKGTIENPFRRASIERDLVVVYEA